MLAVLAGLSSWMLVWTGAGVGGSYLEAAGTPAPPANLTAAVSGSTVSLAW